MDEAGSRPPLDALLERMREQLSVRSYSACTVRAYLVPHIQRQLESVGALHRVDLEAGAGWAPLPPHLHASQGQSSRDWQWQWHFPAERCRTADPGATPLRPHIHLSVVQRDLAIALRAAAVPKHATCHTLRHSFATHLHEAGREGRAEWRESRARFFVADCGLVDAIILDAVQL